MCLRVIRAIRGSSRLGGGFAARRALLVVLASGLCLSSSVSDSLAPVSTGAAPMLTLSVTPPRFRLEPSSLGVALGESVSFQGWASASAMPAFQWLFNGMPLAGAIDILFPISAARFSDAGDYALVAYNAGGAVTSRVATLSVFEPGHLDRWTWRRPSPQGNDLFAVAQGHGVWAAVGRKGARVRSTDGGATWQAAHRDSVTLRHLAFGNGRFVAVGENYDRSMFDPRLQVSSDGLAWVDLPAPVTPPVRLTGVAFGPTAVRFGPSVGGFVVTVSDGAVLHSIDGLQWERHLVETNAWLTSITWVGDRFLALSSQGLAFTSWDGRNWYDLPRSLTEMVDRLAFGNGQLVGCTSEYLGDRLFTSSDGVTWSSRQMPVFLEDVVFDGERFVISGWNGQTSKILTSRDAREWVEHSTGSSNQLYGLAGAGGRWVAVGNRGTILASPDRMNWVTRSSGSPVNLRDVAYGDRRYVAVGNEGLVLTSPDGVTWQKQSRPTTNNLRGIAFAQGRFVAVGEEDAQGGTILTTTNGMTWARRLSPSPRGLYAVTFGRDTFVAVGDAGAVISSVDGLTWSAPSSGVSARLNSVTWGSGLYIAVGSRGTIVYSNDGQTWNRAATPSNQTHYLQGAASGSHVFVAAGQSGVLLVSTNGTEWTNQPSPFEGLEIEDVLFANNRFVLVGESGLIATSRNGQIWRRRVSPCANDLRGVAFADGCFIAVGNNKTVLQSDPTPVPVLHALSPRRPGSFQLQIEGEEDQVYRLQASPDLVRWEDLSSFTNCCGRTPLRDTHAASHAQRFYRVVSP